VTVVDLAIGPSGQIAATLGVLPDPFHEYLSASVATPGGAFGAPQQIDDGSGANSEPFVAFTPAGRGLVVWQGPSGFDARILAPSATTFGSPFALPYQEPFGGTVTRALASDGAGTTSILFSADRSATVQDVRPDGTLAPQVTLDTGRFGRPPVFAVAGDGEQVVVWERYPDNRRQSSPCWPRSASRAPRSSAVRSS
jgi:hypothetical protein